MLKGTSEDKNGDRGNIYEKFFCMLFAVRGYIRKLKDFQLRYQVPEEEFGKFNDIVFDDGRKKFQVFQLKHKENEQKNKISIDELFYMKKKGEYNLFKYVKSLKDILSQNKIERAVLSTNIGFETESDRKDNGRIYWFQYKSEILVPLLPEEYEDAIFDTSKSQFLNKEKKKEVKYYKFNADKIIKILKGYGITFLNQENTEHKDKKLKTNNQPIDIKDITEEDFRNALHLIIYAVNQPNVTELEQIIKEEIQKHKHIQKVDEDCYALDSAFSKWCSTKAPLNDPLSSTMQKIIRFKDVEEFIKKFVKKNLFDVAAPTSSFTGRLKDMDNIRDTFKDHHELAITGLGGIGKTELTKQFIDKYGQSDFDGRVIWIEAENDDSVKNSFVRLAELIGIHEREKKSILTIIVQVFEYFYGAKVLFVFDNFDNNTEGNSGNNEEKNFVIYCRERASGLPKEDRPYFILTSRNRKCLPEVEPYDLSVLTKKDAQKLIIKCVKNSTKEDAGNLAEKLQKLPLAIKQATAYINEQNEIQSVTGGRYEIKDYLDEFDKKTEELLNYTYTTGFGRYEKTTFVTWNVTLNAIQKDENGVDAIQVLNIMSYLYADKIDANMFLPLFEYDETCCGKAFLLLNKYSLITKVENSKFYQIHRVVQAVVQLKYKELEEDILIITWKFINLNLYEKFFAKHENVFANHENFFANHENVFARHEKKLEHWHDAKKNCTVEEYLHYNNLTTYMEKYNNQKHSMFKHFFFDIHSSVFDSAVFNDDVKKIKELKLSKDILKKYFERQFEDLIIKKCNKVIKYFIENGYLDFNDNMPLICLNRYKPNLDLFKYFVEKFESELTRLSTKFICDIKHGKPDSLLELFNIKKPEKNVSNEEESFLKQTLFFASLYNQQYIVELLMDNNVKQDFKIEKWKISFAPIIVAARFGYSPIFQILLKPFVKIEFWNDILQMIFEFLELFADNNDVEHGSRNYTNLYYAQNLHIKIKIAYYLLNGIENSDFVTSDNMIEAIEIVKNDPVKNSIYENIVRKKRLYVPQCEHITSFVKTGIEAMMIDTFEMLKNLNKYKGETELISCVRDLTLNFLDLDKQLDTVKTILNEGVDVNAIDQNGNNALYYAVDLYEPFIFNYLLPKTNSMHEKILMKAIKKDKELCVQSLLKTHEHLFSNKEPLLKVANENKSLKVINHLTIFSKVYENDEMGLINYLKKCIKAKADADFKYVQYLLDNGVNVNTVDSENHEALYYARELKPKYLFWSLKLKMHYGLK